MTLILNSTSRENRRKKNIISDSQRQCYKRTSRLQEQCNNCKHRPLSQYPWTTHTNNNHDQSAREYEHSSCYSFTSSRSNSEGWCTQSSNFDSKLLISRIENYHMSLLSQSFNDRFGRRLAVSDNDLLWKSNCFHCYDADIHEKQRIGSFTAHSW